MEEYFIRFLDMVEELKSASDIQLLHFELFEAAKPQNISKIEEMLGCSLDSSIKDFYMVSNGLQLKWIHKQNPRFDATQHCYQESGFDVLEPIDWYGLEDGCVNILPLQMAFVEQDWGDIIWSYADDGQNIEFGETTRNVLELMQVMKPLDLFSKNDAMVFLVEADVTNLKVLLAQDHFADVESSRITDFVSYIEFILYNWGLIGERRRFYSEYAGHQMPMVITPAEYWQERPRPNLGLLYQ